MSDVNYYKINEDAARRAKEMNSFSDYKAGSATAGYRQMVDKAAGIAAAQKRRVDPMYHEKIDRLLDSYARKLAEGWSDDTYHGGDEARKLIPSTTKKRFRGLMRFERALKDGWCDEAGEPLQKRTPPAPVIQGVLPAVKEKDSGPEPEI